MKHKMLTMLSTNGKRQAMNSGRRRLSRVQKERRRRRRQPVLKYLVSKEASKTQKHHSRLTQKHPFAQKALGLCITYTYTYTCCRLYTFIAKHFGFGIRILEFYKFLRYLKGKINGYRIDKFD